jgi:ribosomal-protein-alanine N-acetyltransferase
MSPASLARLHALCFTYPRPWSEPEFANLLSGTGAFLVSDPQGFALGRAIAGEAELLTIAVAPCARGQGLGRHLLDRFLDDARQQGSAVVFLEVASDNAPALALYRAAGFAECGRRSGYYAGPGPRKTDALVLSRVLSEALPET